MRIIGWRIGRAGWIAGTAALLLVGAAALAQAGLLDGIFKIPLKALDSGKALFLVTEHEGRSLYYFALKSSDGAYRAALDACDVCFRMNRGYRQEGDLMVCNNCGQTFPSGKIGDVKGGCNPHPLPRKVEGGFLVIEKKDIVAGKDYFVRKRA